MKKKEEIAETPDIKVEEVENLDSFSYDIGFQDGAAHIKKLFIDKLNNYYSEYNSKHDDVLSSFRKEGMLELIKLIKEK